MSKMQKKMMKDKKAVTIQMDGKMYSLLKNIAKHNGNRSLASLIRELIKASLLYKDFLNESSK